MLEKAAENQGSELTPNQRLMASEVSRAQALLSEYSSAVIVRPETEDAEGQLRAMFQTVSRLAFLQIEVSKLMTDFFGFPSSQPVVNTYNEILGLAALRKSVNAANPEQVLSEIEGRLQVDLSRSRETLEALPPFLPFAFTPATA